MANGEKGRRATRGVATALLAAAVSIGVAACSDEPAERVAAEGGVTPQAAPAADATGGGKVIGQGSNTEPAGPLQLETYRVAEVATSQPADAGAPAVVYELTITGGPFAVRDIPPTVYLDGEAIGFGQESVDLTALTVTITDRSVLKEGAVISVGYLAGDGSLSELPERLHLDG